MREILPESEQRCESLHPKARNGERVTGYAELTELLPFLPTIRELSPSGSNRGSVTIVSTRAGFLKGADAILAGE